VLSIIWTKTHYFLFDSHTKNLKGEICPDGFSISIRFSAKKELELHVIKNYLDKSEKVFNLNFNI